MTLALKETMLVAVGAFVSVSASVTANALGQSSLCYIALILLVGVAVQIFLVRYDSEDEKLLRKLREREFERLAIELNTMRESMPVSMRPTTQTIPKIFRVGSLLSNNIGRVLTMPSVRLLKSAHHDTRDIVKSMPDAIDALHRFQKVISSTPEAGVAVPDAPDTRVLIIPPLMFYYAVDHASQTVTVLGVRHTFAVTDADTATIVRRAESLAQQTSKSAPDDTFEREVRNLSNSELYALVRMGDLSPEQLEIIRRLAAERLEQLRSHRESESEQLRTIIATA